MIYTNKKIGFHIHTCYSFDSVQNPESVVDYYAERGYEIIVITDHNEIEGARIAKEYALKKYNGKIEIVIGEEILTDIGDLIAFPVKEKIEKGNFEIVISEIQKQEAFACLAHPYSEHDLFRIHCEEIFTKIHFVEAFNSRMINNKLNDYAERYADKYNRIKIIGADAHLKCELGNAYFIWDDNYNIVKSKTNATTKRNIRLSSIIKSFKKKRLVKIPALLFLYIIGK